MSSAPNQMRFRFSTRGLTPAQRLPAWYQVFCRSASRRYCQALDASCHADMQIWTFGPGEAAHASDVHVRVQWTTLTHGIETQRARELLSDGSDDLVLTIQQANGTAVSQCGREVIAGAGAGVLTSNADVSAMAFGGPAKFVSIALSRRMIMALAPGAEDAIARPMHLDSAVLPLLVNYLGIHDDQSAVQSPDVARTVSLHIHELCALAIGASRDAAELARGRGLRQARLQMLKDDIAKNLTRGPVSAADLARRHRVTPRYVHKLFESEGVSLSHFVRAQRLALVHRNLTNPNLAGRTIGTLAFEAGYSDLSTFNHDFRRHYGVTPSALRAAANGAGKAGPW
ncbi:AraC family transcriptional regulator [Bradyrhizobium icense]|uniref:AraC family transcriptional regulator n=1 Tax=Bradyrhizobium icense TaxID=1274631 RepID=UPI001F288135|nr:AraC family transcriptional regulator [Bradyrhizobium icense]